MNRTVLSLQRLSLFFAFTLSLFAPAAAHAQAVTLVPSITKLVGTGTGGFTGDSGTSQASVELNSPTYVAFDALGDMYLSDTLNNCVRKVDASGNISTVAGLVLSGQGDTCNTATNSSPTTAQGLLGPTGLAVATNGDLYIADTGHNCVRRLPSGSIGTANLAVAVGTCGSTKLLSTTPVPNALVLDSASNLYISLRDTTDSIYQVVKHASGAAATSVCIMAGATGGLNLTTCTGVTNTVALSSPAGLTFDTNANLYIVDSGNNCVREITGLTTISTVIGQCADDGSGSATTALHNPYGIAIGLEGSIDLSETSPHNLLHFYRGTNKLQLLAGLPSGVAGSYASNQDGLAALDVPLNSPEGLAIDQSNNIYVADTQNHIIQVLTLNTQFGSVPVNSSGTPVVLTFTINQNVNLSTTIGPDYSILSTTCHGALAAAASGAPPTICQATIQFKPTEPGLRVSALVLHDATSATTVTTGLVGTGTGAFAIFSPGTVNSVATNLAKPVSLGVDSTGNAYFLEAGLTPGTADIKKIAASNNAVTTVVPIGSGLVTPTSITTDAAGDWYVTDTTVGDVLKYSADGGAPTVFTSGLVSPAAAVSDSNGNLYIAQQGTAHDVIEVYAFGGSRIVAGAGSDASGNNEAATLAKFVSPSGLILDQFGDLYIADSGGHRVYYIDNTGIIHFLAGNGTTTTTMPGVALDTALLGPSSLAADAAGDIYIADAAANRVWVAYAATSQAVNMVSIIGTGTAGYSGDNGPSTQAQVSGPLSVSSDSFGDVFVADTGNNAIRKITYPTPTINFGNVATGVTTPAMTTSLWNIGTSNLTTTNPLTISNPQFAANSASTTCGLTILSGATCTLGFTLTPTATGTITGTATVSNTAGNSPEIINLAGSVHALLGLTYNAPAESEVYGSGFSPVLDFTYTGTAPTGTISFKIPGSTLCTVSGTLSAVNTCAAANTGLPVGTYTVTVTYSGDGNYSPITTTTTLTVTPAPLTITTNNATRQYGTPNPVFTGNQSGAVNGDTFLLSFSTTATIASPVGTYPITATATGVGSASLSNYTVTNPGGTLTITPNTTVVPNVAVNCTSKIYGAANPAFTSTVTGALNGDTFTLIYSTTATTSSPVGSYPVTVTVSGPAAANYTTITTTPCTLAVNAAPTATALTTSGTPATLGTSVTFTATVTAPGSTATPTGNVTFKDGATTLGVVALNGSGVATYPTSSLPLGVDAITATYAPSSTNFTGSANALLQTMTLPVGAFTLAVTPGSQLVHGPATTTWQVTVTSTAGFIGPVTLSCAGFPTDGSCTFAQNPVLLTSGSTAVTTMSVVNTETDAVLRAPALPGRPMQLAPLTAAIALPYELGGIGILAFALQRRNRKQLTRLLLLAVAVGMIGLAGCGCPNTAFHTYTLTVTGTAVPGGPAAQSVQVLLSVGQ